MTQYKQIQNTIISISCVSLIELIISYMIASHFFLWWNNINLFNSLFSYWCWLPYFLQYYTDYNIRFNLLFCLISPITFFFLLNIFCIYSFYKARKNYRLRPARSNQQPRDPLRALSDSFGNADWLSLKDTKLRFSGPSKEYGGIVIGEAYRVDQDSVSKIAFNPSEKKTWGQGGKASLLIDPCITGSTHGAVFAGSGGFKTTAVVIPTLLNWTGSAVIFDPSCEIGQMIANARRSMGQKFIEIRPRKGMNILSWLDINNPETEIHISEIIHQLAGDSPEQAKAKSENDIFEQRGRELMCCILADLLCDDIPKDKKTLSEFRQRLITPEKEMKGYLQKIYSTSNSSYARQLAGSLMGVYSETFSGIYSHAVSATKWLSIKAYADMVSYGDFDPKELRNGNLTICIQISERSLRSTPALGRLIIGSLLSVVYQANGNIKGRVLYMLDEVNFLGRLKALADARDGGRKYKITMVLIWQSIGQIEETWGISGKKAWYTSLEWRIYSCIKDLDTQKEISASCGSYTIITTNESKSNSRNAGSNSSNYSSSQNTGISERSRELIKPEEIATRMRTDEQIILTGNLKPIRCGRAIYFRRPEMLKQVNQNNFYTVQKN